MAGRDRLDAATAVDRERVRQRALMAAKRAAGRDLQIPPVRNPRRRRRCEKDPALFLRTYMPTVFYNPFSKNQRAMIDAFMERLRYGGWKAEADPRKEGKTQIACGLTIFAISYAIRHFVVLLGANAFKAKLNRAFISRQFEANDQLGEDFPEICTPIRALGGASQRASAQTVDGERTFLEWTGDLLVLPTVLGSPASGAVIVSMGIDGAVRGLNYQGLLPDLVIIDDPETRETAASETEVERREAILDADVAGLGGPDRSLAILLLCTVWASDSVSDKYTDPTKKPAWDGVRHKLLEQFPKQTELWDRYIELRTAGVLQGDKTGRSAFQFYLDHRREMDEGAIISNPYRFDATPLPDGTPRQISALQACYDIIADTGWENFNTEYQQQPPAEQAADVVRVDMPAIMGRCNGLDRGVLPAGTDYLTAGLDIGGRVIHWTAVSWKRGVGCVVDYDAIPVHSPVVGNLEDPENVAAVQDAILAALCEFRDRAAVGWPDAETGEMRPLDLALVDVGYARASLDTPIYEFVRASPGNVYRPAKGFGTGSGQSQYRHPVKRGRGRRLYNHAHATFQATHRAWLYNVDADYWKNFVHQALLAPADRPGALTLFGSDPIAHRLYAQHLTAEVWTHEYKPGGREIYRWKRVRRQNHWLDTTYNACAAAAILGMKTVGSRPAAKPAAPSPAKAAGAPSAGSGREEENQGRLRGRRISRMQRVSS